MNTPTLPALLAANPRLDQWVGFPASGRVTVSTGRVEIGQGVLTAMLQIAAEELEVALGAHSAADRRHRSDPERRLHRGQPVDPIRRRRVCAWPAPRCARCSSTTPRLPLAIRAPIWRYATAPSPIAASRPATTIGRSPPLSICGAMPPAGLQPRPSATTRVVGRNAPRVDLAAKVFGEPAFIHDMVLDGMVHARVMRQPRRGAVIAKIDEAALRRAAKGPIEIVRYGNFLADPRRGRDGRRSRRRGRTKSCRLGRRRHDQPVPGRSPVAPAAAFDRPRHRPASALRADTRDDQTRGDLYKDAHRPCLGGTLLRARPIPRRKAAGLDPFAGRLPAARCTGADLEARSRGDFGQTRAGAGLLRPQRRRRRRNRCGGHRLSPAGATGSSALAARGGIRLRAGQPGDGGDGAAP